QFVRVQNATIGRGALRARVQGSVVLSDWKTTPSSSIAGDATVRNGSLPDALALAGAKGFAATGTLTTTAYVTGTVGDPRVEADLEVLSGEVRGEPFERVTAHATHSGHLLQVRDVRVAAAGKQIRASASFNYIPEHMDTGRVRFDITTNAMPLDSIRTLA